jgi:hypothetical protein
MKTTLAWIGGLTLVLAFLGTIGVGNFVMLYGPNKIACVKEVK